MNIGIYSLTFSAQSKAAVTKTMSDVPAGENTKRFRQRQQHAIKNVAIVQCDGFRCLAYKDKDVWRDFQTGKELSEVKGIVSTFSV